MKRMLLVLVGLAYGFVSFWWTAFSLVLVLHPSSGPGSKEWPEDSSLIPLGCGGLVLWLLLTGVLFWKMKKDRSRAALFFGAAVLAGGVTLAAVYFR